MKSFAMISSRRSSLKSDVNQTKDSSSLTSTVMKWFTKELCDKDDEPSPLQTEENVVPKTEISRQALNNINIALNVGESSGEVRLNENYACCRNKYCCDILTADSKGEERADNCDDESIKSNKNSKSTLIENLRLATDNASRASEGCRRSSNDKNNDYIISSLDYNRLECPDNPYFMSTDNPNIRFCSGNLRHYLQNYELFTSRDKLRSIDDDKSSINYELLSNLEKQLDETKFNLLKCKIYNFKWRQLQEKFGLEPMEFEDFHDAGTNDRMGEDTRALKEFYNLNQDGCILVHFQDIPIDAGRTVEMYSKGYRNFLSWLDLKGMEIKEKHKVKSSWMKTILKFFHWLSK